MKLSPPAWQKAYHHSLFLHSYYLTSANYSLNELAQAAGTPDWSALNLDGTSFDIYVIANIEVRDTQGTVESEIFDTTISSPAYNEITCLQSLPLGATIGLKARSSSNEHMEGAEAWDSINWFDIHGSERYVQFFAEMSTEPSWVTSISILSYEDYIREQVDNYQVYDFPVDLNGDLYVTEVSSPWIDDVQIDWPGEERIVAITGNIARKNDYGQAKITVDGKELSKVLSIYIKLSNDTHGKTIEAENFVEIEPRNTGK